MLDVKKQGRVDHDHMEALNNLLCFIKMILTKDDWCICRWGGAPAGVSSNNSNLVETSTPQSICITFIIAFATVIIIFTITKVSKLLISASKHKLRDYLRYKGICKKFGFTASVSFSKLGSFFCSSNSGLSLLSSDFRNCIWFFIIICFL